MTSTTTAKAASNGGPATSTEVTPERKRGMARLREDECYYLTDLVLSALRETEHLVREVNDKAASRFRDYRGESGTQPMDSAEVTKVLADAYHCACAAVTYIDKAAERWAEETFEPPY